MKRNKWIALVCVCCLMACLCACGSSETGVYVQSVESLAALGGIAPSDRFPGILVSENVTEIQKDSDKTVAELLVKEGDDVTQGQALFSYDTDQLQLTLDRQKLELEQLKATISNYKDQISELKKDRDKAASSDKLSYTIQIQSLEVELKESELNLTSKENAVTQSEALMENATVYSPITGRVQAIHESGYDNYGNPLAYISIRQAGSYRVKGTIGELQLSALPVGSRIKIISRTDESQVWYGTVSLVDYENPYQGNDNDYYYGNSSDEMTAGSKYPFYVELDSTEGLMLGQHLYLELETEEGQSAALSLSSAFLCFDEDGSCYVWAENKGKLEKRAVTLGEYNDMNDTYEILEGLAESDYIAFPDGEVCVPGAATTRNAPAVEETESGVE